MRLVIKTLRVNFRFSVCLKLFFLSCVRGSLCTPGNSLRENSDSFCRPSFSSYPCRMSATSLGRGRMTFAFMRCATIFYYFRDIFFCVSIKSSSEIHISIIHDTHRYIIFLDIWQIYREFRYIFDIFPCIAKIFIDTKYRENRFIGTFLIFTLR